MHFFTATCRRLIYSVFHDTTANIKKTKKHNNDTPKGTMANIYIYIIQMQKNDIFNCFHNNVNFFRRSFIYTLYIFVCIVINFSGFRLLLIRTTKTNQQKIYIKHIFLWNKLLWHQTKQKKHFQFYFNIKIKQRHVVRGWSKNNMHRRLPFRLKYMQFLLFFYK